VRVRGERERCSRNHADDGGNSAHCSAPCKPHPAGGTAQEYHADAVRLAVAGGGSSDPTPLRQNRQPRNAPKNQVASGQFDLDVDPADGFGSLKNGRRINLTHAEGLGV
jgi:hypothetical protein